MTELLTYKLTDTITDWHTGLPTDLHSLDDWKTGWPTNWLTDKHSMTDSNWLMNWLSDTFYDFLSLTTGLTQSLVAEWYNNWLTYWQWWTHGLSDRANNCLIYRLTEVPTHSPTGARWSIHGLTKWVNETMTAWLTQWLSNGHTGWHGLTDILIHWLATKKTDRYPDLLSHIAQLPCRMTSWHTDSVNDWHTDLLFGQSENLLICWFLDWHNNLQTVRLKLFVYLLGFYAVSTVFQLFNGTVHKSMFPGLFLTRT